MGVSEVLMKIWPIIGLAAFFGILIAVGFYVWQAKEKEWF